MTATDQQKVLKAGFTIIRKREFIRKGARPKRFEIFQKTPERHEWHSREWLFSGVTERDTKVKQLLNDPKIVED
jgi:hypothetical protein